MSWLPYNWWYGNATNWLVGQLSSSVGRRWIAEQLLPPWPTLVIPARR